MSIIHISISMSIVWENGQVGEDGHNDPDWLTIRIATKQAIVVVQSPDADAFPTNTL